MTSPDPDTETPGYDPLAALTITELDSGSRQLKASLVAAITGRTQDYERALAVLLWLHERRNNPGVGLTAFLGLSFVEVTDQLAALGPDETRPTTPPLSS